MKSMSGYSRSTCQSPIAISKTATTTTSFSSSSSATPANARTHENDVALRRNKRLLTQARLNPWYDWWEFEAVGRALCSVVDSSSSRHVNSSSCSSRGRMVDEAGVDLRPAMSLSQALEQVCVWKLRTSMLSHAIESTAALALVMYQDQTTVTTSQSTTALGAAAPPMPTSMQLRLSYSCAVLRSVNGLADSLQQHRAQAGSISLLCQQLGIPSWLVDIRHESTHNQLPTLAVLRLAATTLLQYFHRRYWEPLFQQHTAHRDHARQILKEYQTATERNIPGKFAPDDPEAGPQPNTQQLTTVFGNDNENHDDTDDVEDNDDEEEEADDDPKNSSWGSAIMGKTMNRFEALMEPPSKKRYTVRDTVLPVTSNPDPPVASNGNKSKKNKSIRPSPALWARRFTRINIPMDVAFHEALQFLLWGDSGDGHGVLVDGSSIPMNTEGFAVLRQRYCPLLHSLGRHWAGFLVSLVAHMVDLALKLEQTADDNNQIADMSRLRRLYHLESWVRYVLSRAFLGHFDSAPKSSSKAKVGDDFAALSVLRSFSFPLNSWADRCSSTKPIIENNLSQRLGKLFTDILGEQRLPSYGMPSELGRVAINPDASPTKPTTRMSLAEMEALLCGNEDDDRGSEAHASATGQNIGCNSTVNDTYATRRPAWTKCTTWDPCAIGTMPGYPS